MILRFCLLLFMALVLFSFTGSGQNPEKVSFNASDSLTGYYLAVRPQAEIKGAVILFCSFTSPENILPETKMHNVAFTNNILTIVASVNDKLFLDTAATERINAILSHVIKKFSVDTARIAVGAYGYSGAVILRYAELTYQQPAKYPVLPKAVFAINSPVDVFGIWNWCERQIKKNYDASDVGDAKHIMDMLQKDLGTVHDNPDQFKQATPFYKDGRTPGNEQYLKNVPVRLYYDTDITWHLRNKRYGYYDTNIPDGSELISRLLISGNDQAEFIASKLPGIRNNGVRNPNALSVVDEVEFIQWIKQKLDIFDPVSWKPPYALPAPEGWDTEVFELPAPFAQRIPFKGVEDLRFAPGWADSKSENYWSYMYLWWLGGEARPDAKILQESLKIYYEGLVGQNIGRRNIPEARLVPTIVKIEKVKSAATGTESYKGTVSMLDYMAQKPMVMNCLIHVRKCSEQNRTAVFLELSPKPVEHKIWQQFKKISEGFECKGK